MTVATDLPNQDLAQAVDEIPEPVLRVTEYEEDADALERIGLAAEPMTRPDAIAARLVKGQRVLLIGNAIQISGDLAGQGLDLGHLWPQYPFKSVFEWLNYYADTAGAETEVLRRLWLLHEEDHFDVEHRELASRTLHPDGPRIGARPPLRFMTPRELGTLRPRDWIIRGLFARGDMAMLFGPWGLYKSFVVTALATAVATGDPFLGFETTPGLVAIIVGEGGSGIAGRIRAAVGVARVNDENDPVNQRLHVCCEMPPLTEDEGFDRTARALAALPEPPALLIIDTWARACAAGGLDENKQAEAGALVAAVDRLRCRFPGMAALVVHHTGLERSDRARGSSALPGAVDFAWGISGKRGSLEAKLWVDKIKDGRTPEPLHLSFVESVIGEDDDGRPLTSLRIDSYRQDGGEQESGAEEFARVLGELQTHGTRTGAELVAVMDGKSRSSKYERLKAWAKRDLIDRAEGGEGRPDIYSPKEIRK